MQACEVRQMTENQDFVPIFVGLLGCSQVSLLFKYYGVVENLFDALRIIVLALCMVALFSLWMSGECSDRIV